MGQTQSATSSGTLTVQLQNQTNSSQVYAYVTGQAIDNNYALFLLQADGKTPYYPSSPSGTGASLSANVSIPLGAPGNTVTVTIPRIAGGRIWFSTGAPLQFFLNPGPGLVEPSVFNPSDPNHNTNFSFCEFVSSAPTPRFRRIDFLTDSTSRLSTRPSFLSTSAMLTSSATSQSR